LTLFVGINLDLISQERKYLSTLKRVSPRKASSPMTSGENGRKAAGPRSPAGSTFSPADAAATGDGF
jgi:hypothetical protein